MAAEAKPQMYCPCGDRTIRHGPQGGVIFWARAFFWSHDDVFRLYFLAFFGIIIMLLSDTIAFTIILNA